MWTVLPEIVEPDWLIELATITPMNDGSGPGGGGALLPDDVVQSVPHVAVGGDFAKPLKEAGAAAPLRLFSFHHWAPQKVTEVPMAASLSPMTKLPPPATTQKTNADADELLLLEFGSGWWPLTVAVLSSVEPHGAVTFATIVMVAEPPLEIEPRLHVTVPEHVPWLGVAETSVSPAGSGSFTMTLEAFAGPAFWTVMLYVIGPPLWTKAGPVFVIDKSALLTIQVFWAVAHFVVPASSKQAWIVSVPAEPLLV